MKSEQLCAFSTTAESNAEIINGYQQHCNSQQQHGVKGAAARDGFGGWGPGGSSTTSISKKVYSGFHSVGFDDAAQEP